MADTDEAVGHFDDDDFYEDDRLLYVCMAMMPKPMNSESVSWAATQFVSALDHNGADPRHIEAVLRSILDVDVVDMIEERRAREEAQHV